MTKHELYTNMYAWICNTFPKAQEGSLFYALDAFAMSISRRIRDKNKVPSVHVLNSLFDHNMRIWQIEEQSSRTWMELIRQVAIEISREYHDTNKS